MHDHSHIRPDRLYWHVPGGRGGQHASGEQPVQGIGSSNRPESAGWLRADRLQPADTGLRSSYLGTGDSKRSYSGLSSDRWDGFNADCLFDPVLCKPVLSTLDHERGGISFEQRHDTGDFFGKRPQYAHSQCNERAISDGAGHIVGERLEYIDGERDQRSFGNSSGNLLGQRDFERSARDLGDSEHADRLKSSDDRCSINFAVGHERQYSDRFEYPVLCRSIVRSLDDQPYRDDTGQHRLLNHAGREYNQLDPIIRGSVLWSMDDKCFEYRWFGGIDRRYWSASGWGSWWGGREIGRSAERSSTSERAPSRRGIFSGIAANDYSSGESSSRSIGLCWSDHHISLQPSGINRPARDFYVHGRSDDRDNHSYCIVGNVQGSLLANHNYQWVGGWELAAEGRNRHHVAKLCVQHTSNPWIGSSPSIPAAFKAGVGESELDASVLRDKHNGSHRVSIYEHAMI